MEDQDLPHSLLVIGKACRWFAGIWLLFTVVTAVAAIIDIVKHREDLDSWLSMLGMLPIAARRRFLDKQPARA